MSFARVVPDEDGFDPTAYQSPSGAFVPEEVQERQRLIDDGVAAYERRRVALDLGLPDGESSWASSRARLPSRQAEPPVEAPAEPTTQRVYPKDTASLAADYFGAPAEARAKQEDQEADDQKWAQGFDDGVNAADEVWGEVDGSPEVDIGSMTPYEIQEAITAGELTEDDVRAFARQSLDATLGYAHEYGEERVQELQDYRAQLLQEQVQGIQQAGQIVQQVHRQGFGVLNAQQSLQPALESAGQLYQQLLSEGFRKSSWTRRCKSVGQPLCRVHAWLSRPGGKRGDR